MRLPKFSLGDVTGDQVGAGVVAGVGAGVGVGVGAVVVAEHDGHSATLHSGLQFVVLDIAKTGGGAGRRRACGTLRNFALRLTHLVLDVAEAGPVL